MNIKKMEMNMHSVQVSSHPPQQRNGMDETSRVPQVLRHDAE